MCFYGNSLFTSSEFQRRREEEKKKRVSQRERESIICLFFFSFFFLFLSFFLLLNQLTGSRITPMQLRWWTMHHQTTQGDPLLHLPCVYSFASCTQYSTLFTHSERTRKSVFFFLSVVVVFHPCEARMQR